MLDKAELGYSWFLTWLSRMCLGNQSKLTQFNIKSYGFLNRRWSAHKLWAKYNFGDKLNADVTSPIPTNTSLRICLPDCMIVRSCKGWAGHLTNAQGCLVDGRDRTDCPAFDCSRAASLGTSVLHQGWQKLRLKLNVHAITFRVVNCFKKIRKKINAFSEREAEPLKASSREVTFTELTLREAKLLRSEVGFWAAPHRKIIIHIKSLVTMNIDTALYLP